MVQQKLEFAICGLTLRDGQTTVLDRVEASIPDGACTAVVGRSGAGKSTLLRLLVRLDDPDAGLIIFRGRPIESYDVLDLRRRVQLVTQQPVLLTETIAAEVELVRPNIDTAGAQRLLAQVGLPSSFLDRHTAGLSGGEAQRVCLARALALGPEVLLLDEPTAALDAASAKAIEDAVRDHVERGRCVVLVSHHPDQIRSVADHVVVLDHGRVLDTGTPDAIRYPEATS
jgi:putative ABC transport system ATP-binding protein